MTKCLITTSLLNSLHWYLKESFTKTEAEQRQEFLQTLRREKTPTTEAQQKGLDFEEDIKFYCNNGCFKGMGKTIDIDTELDNRDEYERHIIYPKPVVKHDEPEYLIDYVIRDVGNIVKGGLWQQTVKKNLQVGNHNFLLYGRTDVIKRDTVFDIKFTSNYELGKFQDSSQHLIYLYCSDLPKFSYLISDGKDWWREDYFNHAGVEGEIKSKVSEFLDYLEGDKEAKELYFNNWISK